MTSAVGIQTPTATALRIAKRFPVSCSHWLLVGDEPRWCGHNWAVVLGLAAPELDPVGMIWDYGALGPAKDLLGQAIDHRHLDDVLGLAEPATCQDLAKRVAGFVHQRLASDPGVPFASLVCDVDVEDIWHGQVPRAWHAIARPIRFAAGHWLEGLPDGHQCGRRHGHGYQLGVQVDPAAGGAVADLLQPAEALVRRRLDRQLLNDVLGGLNPTAEHLAGWLATQFPGELRISGVLRVLVSETPTTLAEWRSAEYRP
jgi:6-pyruvoyltetrahydropterin/6-carboxytetrahydropterin synthase